MRLPIVTVIHLISTTGRTLTRTQVVLKFIRSEFVSSFISSMCDVIRGYKSANFCIQIIGPCEVFLAFFKKNLKSYQPNT